MPPAQEMLIIATIPVPSRTFRYFQATLCSPSPLDQLLLLNKFEILDQISNLQLFVYQSYIIKK